jgi:hypothetical protein
MREVSAVSPERDSRVEPLRRRVDLIASAALAGGRRTSAPDRRPEDSQIPNVHCDRTTVGARERRASRGTVTTVDQSTTVARAGASVGLGQPGNPDQITVSARLFAETATGARLNVSQDTIVGGMARRGEVAASWKRGPQLSEDREERRQILERHRLERRDVEDVINSVLGRDPDQIRPFALSWGPLIDLLDRHGITVTEDELIAAPFVFEFSDALLAELEANRTR